MYIHVLNIYMYIYYVIFNYLNLQISCKTKIIQIYYINYILIIIFKVVHKSYQNKNNFYIILKI